MPTIRVRRPRDEDEDDDEEVSRDDRSERTLASWIGYSAGKPVPTVYKWSATDEDLYVAFWPPTRPTDMIATRTAIMHYHSLDSRPIVLKHAAF
jgi:hypothetical protein